MKPLIAAKAISLLVFYFLLSGMTGFSQTTLAPDVETRIASCNGFQSSFNPLSDTTRICDSTASLTAGAGFTTYSWSTGSVAQTITVTSSGLYLVTVTNGTGCLASDSTFLSILNTRLLNADTIICKGSTVLLTAVGTETGTVNAPPSYLWSTGATAASIQVSPTVSSTYTVTVSNGINVCMDSVRVNIDDSLDVTVTALDPTQVCNNNGQVRLQAQGLAASYQWLRNGIAIAGATSPLYVATQTGLYRVVLQSAIGCSGTSSATNVSILPKPIAGFTINQSSQCLRSNQFSFTNTSSLASGTLTYQWNFGNNITSTLAQPTVSYTAAGTYTISLIAIGSGGCRDTLSQPVSVDPSPTVSFSVNSAAQCLNNNLFVFTSNSSISSGSITHLWNFGNLVTSSLSSTTQSYTAPGLYNVKLIVTSDKGCKDSLIRPLTVHPKPIVNFSVNDSAQCLNSNVFIFANSTSVASGNLTYLWTFGDDNTETVVNPRHTYVFPRVYTVVLRATTDNGCVDSVAKVVSVDPKPSVNFTINRATQCIASNNFLFTNNSSITTGSLTYQWTFGAGVGSSLASPSYTYASVGTYSVTLVATSGLGCVDSLTRQVVVHPQPTGVLSQPATTVLCEGQSIVLSASGGSTYQWYLSGIAIPGAVFASHAATQSGTYTVQVISANGCASLAPGSVTLQFFAKPIVDFSYNKSCAGVPIQFTDLSVVSPGSPVAYSWSFGSGQGTALTQHPIYSYSASGFYTVALTVTPAACPGLGTTVSKPVSIVASPPNERYPSINALENVPVSLQARQFDNALFSWSPAIGLSSPQIVDPIFNFNTQVQYLITIRLSIGCVITDTLLVRMFKETEIYVPKGFSPNGDGKNDVLIPRVVGIKALRYFKIYNRWGQLVFQTDELNTGWDGICRGAKQPAESYVWLAEGIDINDQVLKRTGTFILIR
ncbi:MAG: PKD domain-containing protein [Sphingomonadales bacterium]